MNLRFLGESETGNFSVSNSENITLDFTVSKIGGFQELVSCISW